MLLLLVLKNFDGSLTWVAQHGNIARAVRVVQAADFKGGAAAG